MTPCHWCGAAVWDHTAQVHAAWHRAHNLHAPHCGSQNTEWAAACDCGLHLKLTNHR